MRTIFSFLALFLSFSIFGAEISDYVGKYKLESGTQKCKKNLVISIIRHNNNTPAGVMVSYFDVRSYDEKDDFMSIMQMPVNKVEKMLAAEGNIAIVDEYELDDIPVLKKVVEKINIDADGESLELRMLTKQGGFPILRMNCTYLKKG